MPRLLTASVLTLALAAPAAGLEDPTRPVKATLDVPQQQLSVLKLKAVFRQAQQQRALINKMMLRVGERRQGITLLEVHSNRVVVSHNGVQRELLLTANIKDMQ